MKSEIFWSRIKIENVWRLSLICFPVTASDGVMGLFIFLFFISRGKQMILLYFFFDSFHYSSAENWFLFCLLIFVFVNCWRGRNVLRPDEKTDVFVSLFRSFHENHSAMGNISLFLARAYCAMATEFNSRKKISPWDIITKEVGKHSHTISTITDML